MLKQAFENGQQDALVTFKLAVRRAIPVSRTPAPTPAPAQAAIPLSAMPPPTPLTTQLGDFAKGQWGHLQQAGKGIGGLFTRDPAARAAAGEMALGGLKGALPTLGGAAALGLGAYALSGPSEEEKHRRMMQQMMMMRGGGGGGGGY